MSLTVGVGFGLGSARKAEGVLERTWMFHGDLFGCGWSSQLWMT